MNRQSKIPRIPQIDHKEYLSRDCQTIQVRDRKLDVRRMAVACLRHRCNLIPLSNVCKVAPNSLFLAPKVPFKLIGKSTMTFYPDQSWRGIKYW